MAATRGPTVKVLSFYPPSSLSSIIAPAFTPQTELTSLSSQNHHTHPLWRFEDSTKEVGGFLVEKDLPRLLSFPFELFGFH
jgi:hypothetical protein